jgi:SSS family solute:Na+ symporter
MGLPLLLNHILPVGLLGLMLSAYFSAILSTADSCLMAASGNVQTDLLGKWKYLQKSKSHTLRISQIITILIGGFALIIASNMQNVLELMLYSYAFMVSGLLLPVLGALFWKKSTPTAAIISMIGGGGTTIILIALELNLPLGLDANIFGITVASILFFGTGIWQWHRKKTK